MTSTDIDWQAAEYVASRLGAHTRRLVADRDVDAILFWTRPLSHEPSVRGASYHELVLLVSPPATVVDITARISPKLDETDNDEPEETPEEMLQAADAMLVLAEMARERGLERISDLGNLPPLDPATRDKYLARAKERLEREENDE
jgi:hypothetical protein